MAREREGGWEDARKLRRAVQLDEQARWGGRAAAVVVGAKKEKVGGRWMWHYLLGYHVDVHADRHLFVVAVVGAVIVVAVVVSCRSHSRGQYRYSRLQCSCRSPRRRPC